VYAPTFYDQMMFIAQAISSTNSTDPSVVGAALHSTTHKGVVGTYAYDAKGNLKTSTVTIYTFKDGAPVPLASY
jgi:branched-chain amino acid transport system substrate-binding protein